MATHWKKLHNPDYLGAWDLQPGQELILTISTVQVEMVTGSDGKKEQCTVVRFAEKMVDKVTIKPMILNVTNAKAITKAHGTPYIEEWQGRKIQVHVERVKAFGEMVDALRVRPVAPKIVTSAKCEDCGKDIEAIGDRTAIYLAQYTANKYGRALCGECARTAKEQADEPKQEASDPLAEGTT